MLGRALENMVDKEKLRNLGFSSLKKRRGDVIAVYNQLIIGHREDRSKLCLELHNKEERGNGTWKIPIRY